MLNLLSRAFYGAGLIVVQLGAGLTLADEPVATRAGIYEELQGRDVREISVSFFDKIIRPMRLEGEVVRQAIERLSAIGFRCGLRREDVPEKPLWPGDGSPPIVMCEHKISERIPDNSQLVVLIFVKDWQPVHVPLDLLYDQMAAATVDGVHSYFMVYAENRHTDDAIKESKKIDKVLILGLPGEKMSVVVKRAMVAGRTCGVHRNVLDNSPELDCTVTDPTFNCIYATTTLKLSDKGGASKPLSIWDSEREIVGNQSPWVCLNTKTDTYWKK